MVYLTSIDILDTGFLDVATRNGQLGAGNRVNSGNALRLKGVTFDIMATSSLDDAASPAYSASTIKSNEQRALITINPITITLKVVLNASNTDTTNFWGVNDMGLLPEILRLPSTKGWKALYYAVDNTASATVQNRNQQIVYQLGATDTTESQGDINITLVTSSTTTADSKDLTDVNYIPVRFNSVSITQVPGNKVEVKMSGMVTG